ncbi:MAG TPA: ATP-dependent DNA helicase [Nitrososphaeraceae archaeon]|nr:ATP-dependent DNA helicase [Nitrososphaeraceae archaeon]
MNRAQSISTFQVTRNFPFPQRRQRQDHILKEICDAFNSGYKRILLEAPTGFGKSPLAVSFALTLGSSYICTSTKDLQTQYANDFSHLKVVKGKGNFPCLVKEDFIREGKYRCKLCLSPVIPSQSKSLAKKDQIISECKHTTVEYGPCMTDDTFRDNGCKYRTFLKDYNVVKKGTRNESVFIPVVNIKNYENNYAQWLHLKNFKDEDSQVMDWRACPYFDQLNIALSASHSIFNYSNFLALLPNKKNLTSRELLILDEGHLLETELVKFRGLIITKRRWKRYISNLRLIDFGFDDVKRWIDFLIGLETKLLNLLGNGSVAETLAIERKVKYGWSGPNKKKPNVNTRVVSSSDLFESDEQISEQYEDLSVHRNKTLTDEVAADAIRDIERLTRTINNIISDSENWIVSDVIKENYEVVKVEFKPLDISKYCRAIFDRCSKTIIMSATILNYKTFCKNIGLSSDNDEVKFIQVPSDFPVENRPIYPMNVAYLNYNNLQLQEIKSAITNAVDNIMAIHNKHKGIIHTTSYEQLNFIKDNISKDNARRLIVTDPEIQRDEVVQEHFYAKKPTVLISPSLHTGLDLKEDLSRFQIITKVPYPNKSDRWINAKRNKVPEWYYWQTALKLVQAYGRSVRSKDDWAKTYILDSAFQYFLRKNKEILPSWFIKAIKNYNLT